MSDLTKTLLKIFICILIIIAVIFAYGLTIGGYPGIVFYIIMGAIYLLAMLIIKGKKLFQKKYIIPILFIMAIGMLVNFLLYDSFNKMFDNGEPIRSYYSKVDDYPGSAPFEDIMWFKDSQGNTKESTEFSLISEKDFEKGDKIFVEEYIGTFSIEHYKITKAD